MTILAIILWFVSGFAGWAWQERYLWMKYPTIRDDITLGTIICGVLWSSFGPPLLLTVAIVCGLWPLKIGIRWPVIIKGSKP